jgi:hypothetical protein
MALSIWVISDPLGSNLIRSTSHGILIIKSHN